MKKFNKKGFTLIEMLVVIGIIAALVAIVIPTVTNSTEQAKEAADAASLRSLITEATMKGVAAGTDMPAGPYTITQTGSWEKVTDIGGIGVPSASAGDQVTVNYDVETGAVSFSVKEAAKEGK